MQTSYLIFDPINFRGGSKKAVESILLALPIQNHRVWVMSNDNDSWQDGLFVGVDRIDFPGASYWRRDFAPATLGGLMNALAVTTDGILLPRELLLDEGLRVGDAGGGGGVASEWVWVFRLLTRTARKMGARPAGRTPKLRV